MSTKTWLPLDVDEATMAFPANVVERFMPPMKEIPREFDGGHNKWNALVSAWFFSGLSKLQLTPKDGIDEKKAMRHIKAILGSYEPKHEHKEAACAYLLSLWFDDAKWEAAKRKVRP